MLEPLGIRKLVFLPGGFARGTNDSPISLPGLPPAQVLICYEAIFPSLARSGTRPGWLLNITNDAWFGRSAGPFQHLATARFRAIELGLPMVRAANTGISAILDAYGRETGRIPLEKREVLTRPLPPALPPTWVARHGMFPVMVFMLLTVLSAFVFYKKKP
jgi:apolipoprotein N-acyltransferase